MNPAAVTTTATEINRLHAEAKRHSFASRQALQGALVAAWQAGHLLVEERKRVFHTMGSGAWLHWLKANFSGTARTAQRYMRLAHCINCGIRFGSSVTVSKPAAMASNSSASSAPWRD